MIILSDEIAERIEDQMRMLASEDDARVLLPHISKDRRTSAPGYGECSRCVHANVPGGTEPCVNCRYTTRIYRNWEPEKGGAK